MTDLQSFLDRARNGSAILFCGAGLTADCLNFDDSEAVGVTTQLLAILNQALNDAGQPSGFRDIKNAAKRAKTTLGASAVMQLLQQRFNISKISASITDIVRYPWAGVYTTNYDNGIELAFQHAGKKFASIDNTEFPKDEYVGTPIIHLHGNAASWSAENFEQSCILDADSYHHLSGVRSWLSRLRYDIDRADAVIFVGFSAADFHLTDIFFSATELRQKAFFINRPAAEPDLDERATQEDFGTPLYIGREAFSESVIQALSRDGIVEPRLASFSRFESAAPSHSVPPVDDIERLLIWGEVSPQHLKRDLDSGKSDYHVSRHDLQGILTHLRQPGAIVLLNGDICDGKSMLSMETMIKLSEGRPVFQLRHAYEDIASEVSSILSVYPDAFFSIENCFSINIERLIAITRQITASRGSALLTSRTISTDAETAKVNSLREIEKLFEVTIGRLTPPETDSLIALINQIAGWREFPAMSHSRRRRFVEEDCHGVIPSVLLRVIESNYIKDRYKEEFNKLSFENSTDESIVIASLIISSMGFEPQVSFLSNIFEKDVSRTAEEVAKKPGSMRIIRVRSGFVETVPSIGARALLRTVISPRKIVDTTIYILERLASEYRRTDFENHMFTQLMRYSILCATVTNASEINRFFDHISKFRYFVELPLFWLQWHMAMCAQEQWSKAEDYLAMGNKQADAYEKRKGEKYNRRQLDDRKAKFLSLRADAQMRSGVDLFRDMKEALDVVGRLLREADVTHHPYETLASVSATLRSRGGSVLETQRNLLSDQSRIVLELAQRRLGLVPIGYQRMQATEALTLAKSHLDISSPI